MTEIRQTLHRTTTAPPDRRPNHAALPDPPDTESNHHTQNPQDIDQQHQKTNSYQTSTRLSFPRTISEKTYRLFLLESSNCPSPSVSTGTRSDSVSFIESLPLNARLDLVDRRNPKINYPMIRGVEIRSFEQLLTLIQTQYHGFLSRPDLEKMLSDARIHLWVVEQCFDLKLECYGFLGRLSRLTKVPRDTLKPWIEGTSKPMVYDLLNRAITSEEGKQRYNEICKKLNGVTSVNLMKNRFRTLFYHEAIENLQEYENEVINAENFFKFLGSLQLGGAITDIARNASLKSKDILNWYYRFAFPKIIRLASCIPCQNPLNGSKWLPLELVKGGKVAKNFIQVPLVIKSHNDILTVLEKIKCIRTPEMIEYERKFGIPSNYDIFMYLLGLIVSDGWFRERDKLSTFISIGAKTEYNWAIDLGLAYCYAFGRLGILPTEETGYDGKGRINQWEKELKTWKSQASPLFQWIRRILLGLTCTNPKSGVAIAADWILEIPREWKISFLQGISDGDGFATIKGLYVGISTVSNQEFLQRLLASLEIRASRSRVNISIWNREGISLAQSLPLFRHATDRQENLNQLTEMVHSMKSLKELSEEEVNTILNYLKQGMTIGEVVEVMWLQHQTALRPRNLRRFLKSRGL